MPRVSVAVSCERQLTEYFLKHSDTTTLREAIRWFGSPLGRKITREETRAAAPSEQANLPRYAARLRAVPLRRERVILIQRAERADKSTETALNVVEIGMKGLLKTLSLVVPPSGRPSGRQQGEVTRDEKTGCFFVPFGTPQEEIDRAVEQQTSILAGPLRERILLSLFYAYRDISDQELGQYVNYLESESGRKFGQLARGAFVHVLERMFAQGTTPSGEPTRRRARQRSKDTVVLPESPPEIREGKKMVLVKGGTFEMGNESGGGPDDRHGMTVCLHGKHQVEVRASRDPVHLVLVDGRQKSFS